MSLHVRTLESQLGEAGARELPGSTAPAVLKQERSGEQAQQQEVPALSQHLGAGGMSRPPKASSAPSPLLTSQNPL